MRDCEPGGIPVLLQVRSRACVDASCPAKRSSADPTSSDSAGMGGCDSTSSPQEKSDRRCGGNCHRRRDRDCHHSRTWFLGDLGNSGSGNNSPGGGGSVVVDVTAINIVSSDNACHLNGNTFSGYTTAGGGSEQDTLTIPNNNLLLSCTVTSVSATTSGFSISGANTPITIPAGGSEAISFAIGSPSTAYTGVLTLNIE